ncbi:hypothetical protein Hanom_Chr02g00138911 [Helianthus anomalus]
MKLEYIQLIDTLTPNPYPSPIFYSKPSLNKGFFSLIFIVSLIFSRLHLVSRAGK